MSNQINCYECGEKADFVEADYPFQTYCLPCIREMYPREGEGEDE